MAVLVDPEIGVAAEDPGDALGERHQGLATRTPGRDRVAALVPGRQDILPASRQLTGDGGPPLVGEFGEGLAPGAEALVPRLVQGSAMLFGPAEMRQRLLRFVERPLGIPAICPFRGSCLLRSQGRAMSRIGVLLVGRAVADVSAHRDQGRTTLVVDGVLDRARDSIQV